LKNNNPDQAFAKTPGCVIVGLQVISLIVGLVMIVLGINEIHDIMAIEQDAVPINGTIEKKIYPKEFDDSADLLKYQVEVSYLINNRKYRNSRYIALDYFKDIKQGDTIEILVSSRDPSVMRLKSSESTGWGWNSLQCIIGAMLIVAAVKMRSFFRLLLMLE
jgi:hypothetical protein